MAQTFDSELLPKLQAVVDLGKDDVFPKMRVGAQDAVELAKKIGSGSFEKSSNALVESIELTAKKFEELTEVLENVASYYKRLESALQ